MSSNNILNQDKEFVKQYVINKIQDLRLKARDTDDFELMKSLKNQIKKNHDFLALLESGLPFESFKKFDFKSL
jgi:hypothetical protein